ncbi:hypothetical protein ACP4OV_026075 [Aristida adscensionis]
MPGFSPQPDAPPCQDIRRFRHRAVALQWELRVASAHTDIDRIEMQLKLLIRSWLWNGCFPALQVQLYQAWLLFLEISNICLADDKRCLHWRRR